MSEGEVDKVDDYSISRIICEICRRLYFSFFRNVSLAGYRKSERRSFYTLGSNIRNQLRTIYFECSHKSYLFSVEDRVKQLKILVIPTGMKE